MPENANYAADKHASTCENSFFAYRVTSISHFTVRRQPVPSVLMRLLRTLDSGIALAVFLKLPHDAQARLAHIALELLVVFAP